MIKFVLIISPLVKEFDDICEAKSLKEKLNILGIESSISLMNKKFVLISNLTYKKFYVKLDALRIRRKLYKLKIKSYIISEIHWFRRGINHDNKI